MLSEESNQRPKFLTVLDGFTNELPTFMLVTFSFDVCWGVPIIINSVLLSLSLSMHNTEWAGGGGCPPSQDREIFQFLRSKSSDLVHAVMQ